MSSHTKDPFRRTEKCLEVCDMACFGLKRVTLNLHKTPFVNPQRRFLPAWVLGTLVNSFCATLSGPFTPRHDLVNPYQTHRTIGILIQGFHETPKGHHRAL